MTNRTPSKNSVYMKEWRLKNLERWTEMNKRYRASEKGLETRRAIDLRNKFGMTLEQYKKLLEHQCWKCAICSVSFDEKIVNYVDHDHETGVVRGILCRGCNTGLGCFSDDIDRMKDAILYLGKDAPKLESL